MTKIDKVEIIEFTYDVPNLGTGAPDGVGVSNVLHQRGGTLKMGRYAVRITTDDGACGEYVTLAVGTPGALGQTLMLAPQLVGRNADQRELLYDDLKRELRAYDHMGHGPIDIALWDLLGRRLGVSVATLLGGYRQRLHVYASTYHGQESGGGLQTPADYAAFAADCVQRGFRGFKIHGWNNGAVDRECEAVLAVRDAVGPEVALMVDPACEIRTWADTWRLGQACDEAGCLWLEDPYRDGGVATTGHARLRDKIRTPLMLGEHVRGPEVKAGFILSGSCDMVHLDAEYDLGITGVMKLAHLCELLGIDVQFHAPGPAHRACMAAVRNTHFYELALVGPDMPNMISPPVYADGYGDDLNDVGADGCLPVPEGPGLGVTYDWDYIDAHTTAAHSFPK